MTIAADSADQLEIMPSIERLFAHVVSYNKPICDSEILKTKYVLRVAANYHLAVTLSCPDITLSHGSVRVL